jgi:hypothetical protein
MRRRTHGFARNPELTFRPSSPPRQACDGSIGGRGYVLLGRIPSHRIAARAKLIRVVAVVVEFTGDVTSA